MLLPFLLLLNTTPPTATEPLPLDHKLLLALREEQRRVLVLDLTANGVAPEVARTLSDVVAAAVGREPGFNVKSAGDIRAQLGREASQELLGCNEADGTCNVAEIAGALGAELIVFGSVGVLGTRTIVSTNLYDTEHQLSAGREQVELDDLSDGSRAVSLAVARLFGHADPVTAPPPPSPLPAIVGGIGAGALVVGSVAAAWGAFVQGDATSGGAAKEAGVVVLPVGAAVAGAGLVAGGVAVALFIGDEPESQTTAATWGSR